MENMMQNIQNGSINIKTGERMLRIISAAKHASSPSILSYKTGGGTWGRSPPPSQFGPNLYAKNVINVF